MNGDPCWLWPLTHLVTAVVFLCLGWRFGRESVGRPPFDYPLRPAADDDPGEADDPWTLAAGGGGPPGTGVDRNETAGLP